MIQILQPCQTQLWLRYFLDSVLDTSLEAKRGSPAREDEAALACAIAQLLHLSGFRSFQVASLRNGWKRAPQPPGHKAGNVHTLLVALQTTGGRLSVAGHFIFLSSSHSKHLTTLGDNSISNCTEDVGVIFRNWYLLMAG